MGLNVAYSYCCNLTEEEKVKIDKQVRKNQRELIIASFFPFSLFSTFSMPQAQYSSYETFTIPGIIRQKQKQADRAIRRLDEKIDKTVDAALTETAKAAKKAATKAVEKSCKYKLYSEMPSKLGKISENAREDTDTKNGLDQLQRQLERGEFKSGRGSKKLKGCDTVYYMRSGGEARLFFRYSPTEDNAIEILAESNKEQEQDVIDNLIQNYD